MQLIKARVLSFSYSLATLVGLSIIGVLTSPDFSALVQQHFGDGASSMLILLVVSEGVKHVRNLKVLKDAERSVGGEGGKPVVLI